VCAAGAEKLAWPHANRECLQRVPLASSRVMTTLLICGQQSRHCLTWTSCATAGEQGGASVLAREVAGRGVYSRCRELLGPWTGPERP
jgi:hypothetical protein